MILKNVITVEKLNSNIRCIEMLRNVSLGGQGES